MKKINFNAGPSIMPQEVFDAAAKSVLDFNGMGLSILEISHRSKEFVAVLDEARALFKEILDIQTAQIAATAHAYDFDWHYQSGYYPIHTIAKLDRLWKKALNADITDEQRFNVEVANLSWEYFKANQFLGEYFFLNPFRLKANEELYDAFKSHGVSRVSSFATIPENKEDVDFMLRPFNWG